jgi:hypothetical protein
MGRGRVKKIEIDMPLGRGRDRFWKRSVPRDILEAEQRGDNLRIVFGDEYFEERWSGFTVELYGFESDDGIIYPPRAEGRVWDEPPGPFFFLQSSGVFKIRHFLLSRITHELSSMELIVHWWPTHGRQFKLTGPLTPGDNNEDISIIGDAMEFFRVDLRGEPKVSEIDLVLTMRELGDSATQAEVASELKVSPRTLQRWIARNGFQSWDEYKDKFRPAEVQKS